MRPVPVIPTCRRLSIVLVVVGFLLGSFALPASAQPDGRVGASIEAPAPGDPTEVFVLATTHLSQIADRFEPSMLDSLRAALRAFRPDAICVEALPGRQVAAMERWGGTFDRVAEIFAASELRYGHIAQRAEDLSWTAANRRADSLLTVARDPASSLRPEARLQLVTSLVAAYRLPTAALQWSTLSDTERASPSTVPDTLARHLDAIVQSANETASIGLHLARELGHARLYPIDAQGSKDLFGEIWPAVQGAFQDSLGAVLDQDPAFQREDALLEAGIEDGSLMPYYRFVNAERFLDAKVNTQFRRAFLQPSFPDDLGRKRIALWETRNLNMAARIRRASYDVPGGRMLVIVGSSHKPFLDHYLRRMMGVRVVDAASVWAGAN